jgi:toxin ParE1/3/4
MAAYSLSAKAAADLDGIYEYTILQFGHEQARAYLLGLHERFEMLAEQPDLGRNAEELTPDLRRSEYQSHVVFYVAKIDGVRIVRVLHEGMDVKRHLGRSAAR